MTADPVRDLTHLHDHFVALRDALAMNDVAGVEAAAAALRAAMSTLPEGVALTPHMQTMVRDVTALSGEVADALASRLRAFDIVIEALRTQEGAQP